MPKERWIKPDHWYFAVDCASCGEPFPIAEAPSPEKEPAPRHATIRVRCPHCRKEHTYAGALVSRRQGPEGKSQEPPGADRPKSNT
jgi:hypothetical protein